MVKRTLVIRSCLSIAVLGFGLSVGMPSASTGELIDFFKIQGKWTGFGWLLFSSSDRQRARCTALIYSTGGPNKGNFEIKCTTEQYEIDAKAFNIVFNGTKATGKFFIRNYSIHGTIDGSITKDGFSVYLKPITSGYTSYGARLSTLFKGKCRVLVTIPIFSPLEIDKFVLNLRRC